MIEERAVVLALQAPEARYAEQAHGVATIEIVRKTACGLCGQTRGCGNSIWGKLFGHNAGNFTAQNAINAQVGDHVIVGLEESVLIKSAFMLYLLPLTLMLLGAWSAKSLYGGDGITIVGAFFGLALGFVWVKGHAQGSAYYRHNQPTLLRFDRGVQEHPITIH